jgi:hypothetical protein
MHKLKAATSIRQQKSRQRLAASGDCAAHDYGVTSVELDAFVQKIAQELQADRKARRLKTFPGKLKRG